MKQLLLLAMLCIGLNTTKAQSIIIYNHTACDAHFILYGDDPMGNCGASYRSEIYTIPSSGIPGVPYSIFYPDPAGLPFPGMVDGSGGVLGSTGWFSHVRFPQCSPAICPGCGTSSVVIGDGSCGASNINYQAFYDASCTVSSCGTVTVTYTNTGGNITIDIF